MSNVWKDAEGRDWEFRVDTMSVVRIKQKTGKNIARIGDDNDDENVLGEILDDPVFFFEVAECILRDKLDERGMTAVDFFNAMTTEDDMMESARACVEGVLSFFPMPKRTPLLKAFRLTWKLGREREALEVGKVAAELADEKLEAIVTRCMDTAEAEAMERRKRRRKNEKQFKTGATNTGTTD